MPDHNQHEMQLQSEETRRKLEDALRLDPLNGRLHLAYTEVFLRLGQGDEARSSANCALELSPEGEKPQALVLRAAARVLQHDRDGAVSDLLRALSHQPEVRGRIREEPLLHALLRDRRLRDLVTDPNAEAPTVWRRMWRWVRGER